MIGLGHLPVNATRIYKSCLLQVKVFILFILISKRVLHTLFANQNLVFYINGMFFFFLAHFETEKGKKRKKIQKEEKHEKIAYSQILVSNKTHGGRNRGRWMRPEEDALPSFTFV